MWRRGRVTVAVMAAGVLLAACAAQESPGGATTQPAAGPATGGTAAGAGSAGSLKIGVDIELSGGAAVQGEAYQRALQLVADQVNSSGGVKGQRVELVIRDNKSDPTEALQVAKGLIEQDRVVALIGGGSSPTTLSLVDTVEGAGVPTVSMGSSGAITSPPDKRRFVFKTPADTPQIVKVIAADMTQQALRNVALLSVNNAYGDAGLKGWQESASRSGLELVANEKFEANDKDFTTQMTKLVGSGADAVVVWAIPPGAGIAARNAKALGWTKPIYFDAGAGAELFLRGAADAAEGILMAHPRVLVADQVAAAPNKDVMTQFYKSYTAKYGEYSGFASYAADALGLIVEAAKKGGTERAQIRDALETLSYNGITGVYQMSPTNHTGISDDALTIVTVKGGKWTLASSK